jgi:hypothetical protein
MNHLFEIFCVRKINRLRELIFISKAPEHFKINRFSKENFCKKLKVQVDGLITVTINLVLKAYQEVLKIFLVFVFVLVKVLIGGLQLKIKNGIVLPRYMVFLGLKSGIVAFI